MNLKTAVVPEVAQETLFAWMDDEDTAVPATVRCAGSEYRKVLLPQGYYVPMFRCLMQLGSAWQFCFAV